MWGKSPWYTIKQKKQLQKYVSMSPFVEKNDRERIHVGICVYEYVKEKTDFSMLPIWLSTLYNTQLKTNRHFTLEIKQNSTVFLTGSSSENSKTLNTFCKSGLPKEKQFDPWLLSCRCLLSQSFWNLTPLNPLWGIFRKLLF